MNEGQNRQHNKGRIKRIEKDTIEHNSTYKAIREIDPIKLDARNFSFLLLVKLIMPFNGNEMKFFLTMVKTILIGMKKNILNDKYICVIWRGNLFVTCNRHD